MEQAPDQIIALTKLCERDNAAIIDFFKDYPKGEPKLVEIIEKYITNTANQMIFKQDFTGIKDLTEFVKCFKEKGGKIPNLGSTVYPQWFDLCFRVYWFTKEKEYLKDQCNFDTEKLENSVKLAEKIFSKPLDELTKDEINIQDQKGRTPLMLSIETEDVNLIGEIAIASNKSIKNLQDTTGTTALMKSAADTNLTGLLTHLLTYTKNLDIQDDNGNTALMIAAKYGNSEGVSHLIKAGADTEIKNKAGKKAIDLTEDMLTKYLLSDPGSFRKMTERYEKAERIEDKKTEKLIERINDIHAQLNELNEQKKEPSADITKITDEIQKLQKEFEFLVKKFHLKARYGAIINQIAGFLYLLMKHRSICSTLAFIPFNEIQNLEGFKEYIEFKWICDEFGGKHVLKFPLKFDDTLNYCKKTNGKEFIIYYLALWDKDPDCLNRDISWHHANYLVFNLKTHELIRFEPFGMATYMRQHFDTIKLDEELDENVARPHGFKFQGPSSLCPVGIQAAQELELLFVGEKLLGPKDPRGFCVTWVIWLVDQLLKHPNLSFKEIEKNALDKFSKARTETGKAITMYIKGYSEQFNKIKKEIGLLPEESDIIWLQKIHNYIKKNQLI